mgnify:CR=1 FL=1
MHVPQLALAIAASAVVASFTDWLFMGVLFHDRYLKWPEIWRNPPGKSNTGLIIRSQIIGIISSAGLATLLVFVNARDYVPAFLIAGFAWAAGPVPILANNSLWIKFDSAVALSHAIGWLARYLITAALVVLLV